MRSSFLLLSLLLACTPPEEGSLETGEETQSTYMEYMPSLESLRVETTTAGFTGQRPPPGDGVVDGPFDGLQEWGHSIDNTLNWFMTYINLARDERPFATGESDGEWRVELPNYPGREFVLRIRKDDDRYIYEGFAGPIAFEPEQDDRLFNGATVAPDPANPISWTYTTTVSVDAIGELQRDATVQMSGEIELSGHPTAEGGWEVFYDYKDVAYADGDESWSRDSRLTYNARPDGISQFYGSLQLVENGLDGPGHINYVWSDDGGRFDQVFDGTYNGDDYAYSITGCWGSNGSTVFDGTASQSSQGADGLADGDYDSCVFGPAAENPDGRAFDELNTSWSSYGGGGFSPSDRFDVVLQSYDIDDPGFDATSALDPVFFVIVGDQNESWRLAADTTTDSPDAVLLSNVTASELLAEGVTILLYDEDTDLGESPIIGETSNFFPGNDYVGTFPLGVTTESLGSAVTWDTVGYHGNAVQFQMRFEKR